MPKKHERKFEMQKITRILALLLAVMMVLPLFACANDQEDDPKSSVSNSESSSAGSVDIDKDPEDMTFLEKLKYLRDQVDSGLPTKDCDGTTVKIDARSHNVTGNNYDADWIMSEEFTSDTISNALYTRHLNVESRFNVDIQYDHLVGTDYSSLDQYNQLRVTAVRAGLGDIDIIGVTPWGMSLVLEGIFEDMNQLDYINFDNPWWFGDVVEGFEVDGHATIAFGAITPVSIFGGTFATLFNRDLCEDLGVEDLYQVVREGRWDYEYAKKLTQDCYADIDGVDGYTEGDIYGADWTEVKRLFWGFGGKYITYDEAGEYVLNMNTESIENIFNKTRELVSAYQYTADGGKGVDGKWFEEGRILLRSTNVVYIEECGDWDFTAGIIPNPKLDSNQENYVAVGYFAGVGITIDDAKVDRNIAALVVEALAYYGWYDIVPTYYETILKLRQSSDEQNAEMLDLMFNNFCYEPTWIYCGEAANLITSYCQNSNQGFSSFIKRRAATAAKTLKNNVADLRTKYDKLFGKK